MISTLNTADESAVLLDMNLEGVESLAEECPSYGLLVFQ